MRHIWSQEEENFLRNNYLNQNTDICCAKIGVSASTIHLKAHRMGLVKYPVIEDGYKICPQCARKLPIRVFHKNKQDKKNCSVYCKSCTHSIIKHRKAENPYRFWARATIHNHRKKYSVLIDVPQLEDIARQTPSCQYCNRNLSYSNTMIQNDSATIDRINNEPFLTPENVMICCYQCNSTKRDRTLVQFLAYLETALPIVKQLVSVRHL